MPPTPLNPEDIRMELLRQLEEKVAAATAR